MAMAGLIQDQTKQADQRLPGLSQLPVLGALFRSRDYLNSQTELMVLVPPISFAPSRRRTCRARMTDFAAARINSRSSRQHQSHLRRTRPRRTGRNYRGSYALSLTEAGQGRKR